ncbi:DUF7483 domain-containing protein [Salibacterium lacus]|uniref:DUF7483 domain-containing protein n=1 Tax=Salibacterium lacus TaxID=1898109 RepID=A0ABW5SY48_9BACI
MATDKLNLPEITDNMTADVPRDMNALAEAVDGSAQKDIAQGTTAPASPVADDLWLDTTSAPYVLKRYDGAAWVNVGELPPVDSVNGQTGAVTLDKEDVGLANVTNDQQATKTEFNAHISDDATKDSKGHVQIGDGISVSDGEISTSKSDIGIENVTNDEQATKTEFNNHVGSRGESVHGLATSEVSGFMSPSDKQKTDDLEIIEHVTGSYTGDGSDGRSIVIGFRPKLLYVVNTSIAWGWVAIDGAGEFFVHEASGGHTYGNNISLTSNGFEVSSANIDANNDGDVYYYYAIV